jgi:hypothetical protein
MEQEGRRSAPRRKRKIEDCMSTDDVAGSAMELEGETKGRQGDANQLPALPPEIVQHCLSFLGAQDLLTTRCVSRLFLALADLDSYESFIYIYITYFFLFNYLFLYLTYFLIN